MATKPLPPPPQPKPKQTGSSYQKWVNAHPAVRPYAGLISKWAQRYGVDPIYLAALILFESGGNPNARSKANAVGLAQIHLPSHPNITEAQAKNPAFAVKFAAQYFGQQLTRYGTYEAAYRQGYNPGYKGGGPFTTVPKGYVATGKGLSPAEAAVYGVEKAAAKEQITQAEFLQRWDDYNQVFRAYTAGGRNATRKEAMSLYNRGWSIYTLARGLAKQPGFYKSDTWKANADRYVGTAKNMGMVASRKMVADAIVNNWDTGVFQEKLRKLPSYLKSNEFKSGVAGKENVYRAIYGEPSGLHRKTMQEVTLGRWTDDQWASYLRSLPEYRNSAEYQSSLYGLQGLLGYLPTQHQQPALSKPRPAAPDSPRIPGDPNAGY